MMTADIPRNPIALLRWQARKCFMFAAMAVVAWVLIDLVGWTFLKLPVMPISVVGAAIGIFTSFRANQAYDRWWEGRKLWGRMINSSRHWADQVRHYLPAADQALAERLVIRHVSYVHTLRCLLRGEDPFADPEFLRNVHDADRELKGSTNLTHALLDRQLADLVSVADGGRLDGLRLQSLDQTLMDFLNIQGGCERIKGTPLPRGVSFISDLLIESFALMMPFALVHDLGFVAIPMNVVVCLAFLLISEAGRVLEDPFSLFYNGLPLSNLSIKIERNLRERLGHTELPPSVVSVPPGVLM